MPGNFIDSKSYVHGYGFRVYATGEELRQFIVNHSSIIKTMEMGQKLLDYIHKVTPATVDVDSFPEWKCMSTGQTGAFGIIADTMYKETGILFHYYDSGEEDGHVIVYPLSQDVYDVDYEIHEKLKSYMEELNYISGPELINP